MVYRCAKDLRVPAASVCPFGLWGVFCLLDLFFFLFLLLGTPFLLSLVGWTGRSAKHDSRVILMEGGLSSLLLSYLNFVIFQPLLAADFGSSDPIAAY